MAKPGSISEGNGGKIDWQRVSGATLQIRVNKTLKKALSLDEIMIEQ